MASEKREPGYTEESLRMLETAEGQSNAVIACFGSAAQHAQLFGQALARFLGVYNRIIDPTRAAFATCRSEQCLPASA
jgi:hypothetical protein